MPSQPQSSREPVTLPWVQKPVISPTHHIFRFFIVLLAVVGVVALMSEPVADFEGNLALVGLAALLGAAVFGFIGFGPTSTMGRQVTITEAGLTVEHPGWRLFPFGRWRDGPRLRLSRPAFLPAAEIERYYHATSGDRNVPLRHQGGPRPSHNGNKVAPSRYFLLHESSDAIVVKQRGDRSRPWWLIPCQDPEAFLAALAQSRNGATE